MECSVPSESEQAGPTITSVHLKDTSGRQSKARQGQPIINNGANVVL